VGKVDSICLVQFSREQMKGAGRIVGPAKKIIFRYFGSFLAEFALL